MILCFDGGGSKCRMILADDDFNLIGEGRGLGVNVNHTPLAEAVANMRDCLDQTLRGVANLTIDSIYITIVGPVEELIKLLAPYRTDAAQNTFMLGEPQAALWAGALKPGGFVALSGTGSDVFYVSSDEKRGESLGGWGLLLGDEGSGAWIGQQALRTAVRSLADVGPKTILADVIRETLNASDIWELVRLMYAAPSYVRFFGSLVPITADAARRGDGIARQLFRDAGIHMSEYFLQLYARVCRRVELPEDERFCVLSGGAWKAFSAMFDTFRQRLGDSAPVLDVRWPYFEPVMAGISRELAVRHPDWDTKQRLDFLTERFPSYRINPV
ncbi:N-acetylmuramic acid/N-acetylglucosamine kinase [Clostridia bacterium]|nr:N-acetylmuramic acid/N-acetylglucosamine kinase [Clostridia bacterium]